MEGIVKKKDVLAYFNGRKEKEIVVDPANVRSLKTSAVQPGDEDEQLMTAENFQIRQLADELQSPDSGKQSIVLADDASTQVVLFAFAAGAGLAEHAAPMPAIIQIF